MGFHVPFRYETHPSINCMVLAFSECGLTPVMSQHTGLCQADAPFAENSFHQRGTQNALKFMEEPLQVSIRQNRVGFDHMLLIQRHPTEASQHFRGL